LIILLNDAEVSSVGFKVGPYSKLGYVNYWKITLCWHQCWKTTSTIK